MAQYGSGGKWAGEVGRRLGAPRFLAFFERAATLGGAACSTIHTRLETTAHHSSA